MITTRPCYAIVVSSDSADGNGRPIIWESYLDRELADVEIQAEKLKAKGRDAWVIELPIMLRTEIIAVAGETSKIVHGNGASALAGNVA